MSTAKTDVTARALDALTRARQRIEELERQRQRQREPIAIVGMACRYPGGVEDPDAYWDLLAAGIDATCERPAARWADEAGPAWRGGFLTGALDAFDAAWFSISRREARAMDPQQRLLLEVAWEALERAGQPPRRAEGRAIGVYVGVATHDFADVIRPGTPRPGADFVGAFEMTGAATYAAAGRLSYTLGLTGPSLVVDTACSSSLVAVHLAVQALHNGECEAALAGGVNCLLAPEGFVALSQAGMLAADGRCKSFAAAADGMARGEGCGLIVLQRLGDAQRAGAPILGVILGSAVNQDGPSGGFTVPSGQAQRAVLRAAIDDARVRAAELDYVEAHGTGTPLGDPIELGAIEAIYGEGRPADQPLFVGSAKANLAHLEGAAGIAGLMRALLAIERGVIPPHRLVGPRSDRFDWAASHLALPTTANAWPHHEGGGRLAAVSAFGAGGTNAHVILGRAPAVDATAAPRPARVIVPVWARDPDGVRALAARWAEATASGEITAGDLAITAGRRALPGGVRAAVHGDDLAAVRAGLAALAHAPIAEPASAPKLAVLFTGQGELTCGFAGRLFADEPRFRAVIERCDAALGPTLEMPLARWLCDPARDPAAPAQAMAQPALFAFEVALLEVWRAWGIEIGAVLGHSLGEYAAAYAAGMASLPELLHLVAARGRLMARQVLGRMIALAAQPARVIEHLPPTVSIAAINGPSRVVIAGSAPDLAATLDRLRAVIPGLRHRELAVDRAFHSPHVEPLMADLRTAASQVAWRAPALRMITNLTGDWLDDAPTDWARHARAPVQFAAGLDRLRAAGFTHFLEIGPGATLTALAGDPRAPGRAVASLGAGNDLASLHAALAVLYAAGVEVDWPAVHRDTPGRPRPDLPTRPWQRTSLGPPIAARARHTVAVPTAATAHPLLGARWTLPDSAQRRFQAEVSAHAPAFVAGHRVAGRAVFPAAGFVELSLAALAEASPGRAALAITDLVLERPLIFDDDAPRALHLVVEPAGEAAIHVHDTGGWQRLCRAREAAPRPATHAPTWDLTAEIVDGAPRAALASFADRARAAGIEPGPGFAAITTLWVGDDRALGVITVPPAWRDDGYRVSPWIFDAAIHVVAAGLEDVTGVPWMQAGIARVAVHGGPPARLWVRATVRARDARSVHADLIVTGDDGQAWLELDGLQLRRTARADAPAWHAWLYATHWRPAPEAGHGALAVSLTALAEAVGRARADWYDAPALTRYGRALAALDQLAARHVLRALHQLGWRHEPLDADRLSRALDIVPAQHRAFAQLLRVARDHAPRALIAPPSLGELRRDAGDLRVDAPMIDAELTMLERCGEQLADILRGRVDPLGLLFPGNDTSLATRIYTESPGSRAMNALARRTLIELIAALPAERGLRVLEIGAGTGGTTASLLPTLDGRRVHYTFTDIGPVFLAKARERFAGFSFVDYAVLDIEADPTAQGFTAGDYDIVIATNVLHATRDLDVTVRQVRRLLAPGGALLLIEGSAPIAWIDLSFGLTAGWWRFTDAATRGGYPLISGARWIERLGDHGFAAARDLTRAPDLADDPVLARSAMIVATADDRDPRVGDPRPARWLVIGDDDPVCARLPGARSAGEIPDLADIDRVVFVATAPPTGDDGDLATRRCASLLHLAQAMLRAARPIRLFVVTRAAHAVIGDEPVDVAMSAVCGLVRNIAIEHPELGAHLIDLDGDPASTAVASALLARPLERLPDEAIAVRTGRPHVMRLGQLPPPTADAPTFTLRAQGWILITGGLRGIGWEVACSLAAAGHRHLALLGRTGPTPAVEAELAAWRAAGHTVRVLTADVADADALDRALTSLRDDGPPLRAVLHAAGVFRDHLVRDQQWSVFAQVLAPKVAGSWNMHRLTLHDPLEHFIGFSSGSSLIGATGLASYVAANSFVDALAAHRRARGLPAQTLNWGAWHDVGMAAAVGERREAQWHADGLAQMDPALALDAFAHAAAFDRAQLAIIALDAPRFLAQHQRGAVGRFLSDLRVATDPCAPAARADTALRTQLAAAASPGARRRLIEDHLERSLAELLDLAPGTRLDLRKGFFDLGLDSLLAVELRNRLQIDLGCELPTTLTFRFPTPVALVDHLAGAPAPVDHAIAEIEALSTDELEALINDNFDAVHRGPR